MNWRAIWAIVRKDLLVVSQSKGVIIPLMIVPVMFFVLLPALVAFIPAEVDLDSNAFSDFGTLLDNMPPGMLDEFAGKSNAQVIVSLVLVYMLAPMFLIVPLMVASTIAADSFAGEKERKTLEALLYTPTTDQELFLAKVLSAWLPAVAITLAGFLLYGIVANAAGWHVMEKLFFPNWLWILLVVWVAPAAAGLGLSTMVLVSSRVSGFQEAYQTGSAIVIPVLLLFFGQITGILVLNVLVALVLGLLLWLIDGALLWFGVRTFQRNELLAKL